MKYLISLIIVVLAIVGIVYLNRSSTPAPADTITGTPITPVEEKTATFTLSQVSNSGKTGTLLLASEGNKTRATLTVSGEAATADRPAHIHVGSCPTPGAVKYPLINVIGGSSVTILDVNLDSILVDGPLSVNVHESAAKLNNYIACGNITAPATTQTTTGTSNTTVNTNVTVTVPATKTVSVSYSDAGFSPATVTINKGDAVKFTNNSSGTMRVASNPHPVHTDLPGFDEGTSVNAGGTYTFTFDKIGSWSYHNHNNPSRSGMVIVK